jgi:organic radical activating enzyme
MSKLKVAEIFYSLQGEGKFVGVPSVFLRTFGCNFQCRGFGMPSAQKTTEPEQIAEDFKKHPEWRYEDLPLARTGCDSYASWHPAFKDLSPTLEIPAVMKEIETVRQSLHGRLVNDGRVHLVITGGEPLLGWQRAYPELFVLLREHGYTDVTFETNGTQPIAEDFANFLLVEQIKNPKPIRVTFSVSAKLPCSGERIDEALKPEVVASYQQFGETYLKFVVANKIDVEHAKHFIHDYQDAGWDGDVYLMPVGGISDLYNLTAPDVAALALSTGYKYSPRLQVDIWKNAWGT